MRTPSCISSTALAPRRVASILSAALGLYLCRTVSDALLGKQTGSVGTAVRQCGQILLWWALPLIAAAAVIETYVTPALIQAVL